MADKTKIEKKDFSGFTAEWQQTLKETDFDGHTSFQSMTFTQKLTWLSEAIESIYQLAKDNPASGCTSLFTPGQKN